MNSSLKYGLIGGLSLSVLLFAGYSMQWYKVSFKYGWTILEILILVFSLYFGVKESRRIKYPDGIRYKNAVLEGFKILLVITVIHSVSIYLYFAINEEKFAAYKAYTAESAITAMKKAGYSETDINKFEELVQTEFTPFTLAKDNSMYDLLLGLIFVLLIASILRKKDPIPIQENETLK